MNESKFMIVLKLRIDWSDQDYFKHVNNVSFFKYIQSARVNYWDKIGLTDLYENTNVGPILASCKCDFKKPLYFPGEVIIQSYVKEVGNTSFSLHHQLFNGSGEVVAEAIDIVVVFDFNKNIKVNIPSKTRSMIKEIENKA